MEDDKRKEELIRSLSTPKDISTLPIYDQASIIALSFIGYCATPIGISKELLAKCANAFNNHRGKIEWETEAIEEVLEKEARS